MALKLTALAETKLKAFCKALAIGYSVNTVAAHFSVTPETVDKIAQGWRINTDFLNDISILPVDENSSNVIKMTPQSVTRKVNTDGGEKRVGTSIVDLSKRKYDCNPTPQDVKIPFSLLNTWAHMKNFREQLVSYINNARSADLIIIGWHGTSDAVSSDPATNTLLQDCGIGWPKILQTDNPTNYITEGDKVGSGKVYVNPTAGDYKTFDSLVVGMKHLIPDEKRTGNEVVILGDDIVSLRDSKLYDGVEKPSDTEGTVANRCGGLPVRKPPHKFPKDAIFVGDLKMLQIYLQVTSVIKASTVEHDISAFMDWMNSELDWQIEDPDCVVFIPSGVITNEQMPA